MNARPVSLRDLWSDAGPRELAGDQGRSAHGSGGMEAIVMNVAKKLNEFDTELLSGFGEAMTFADLRSDSRRGPDEVAGIYAVIYPFDHEPKFVFPGTGGSHKKKDPNVSVEELHERWVRDSRLLYFGKAGGPGKKSHLRE